ncbi:MAG: DUF362 domain-containing protein [Parcubacteria group bacterium]|nr:DUF362 domain-containing protein [Parcubacteria group bacterium]
MNEVGIVRSLEQLDLSFIEIHPGDWVMIKPNFIKESREDNIFEWQQVITSPELIMYVCVYVARKLQGKGKISIGDAPQADSSFSKIIEKTKLDTMIRECSRRYTIPIELLDLRNEEWLNRDGVIVKRRKLSGDPCGAIRFNLGEESFFYGFKGEGKYYGADYDIHTVNKHHQHTVHEYLLCATPIHADVFINLPKLKTHKKTGVTLSLKNLVGINADKNWLPHYTEGTPIGRGDQFPDSSFLHRAEQKVVRMARLLILSVPFIGLEIARLLRSYGLLIFGSGKKVIRSGNWHGNDTTWRMALDLNRCLLYGDKNGVLQKNRKRYYTIIDGIIGMEGDGPMQGEAIKSDVILYGCDPVIVDMVSARIMGFDWRKIPIISKAFTSSLFPLTTIKPEEVVIKSVYATWKGRFTDVEYKEFLHFKPHFGWKGYIEFTL